MALGPGTRVGPYEIQSAIGAGGMGEVYRARDTRLQRDVAIKVLPDHFAADPERLARFEREAQILASLNHPHIAAIYGLEEAPPDVGTGFPARRSSQSEVGSRPTRALILELVEGDTLADRIARGAIPLDEALPIARQIAEALEAAHEQGITHRDLKPANIKITPSGVVKVLDFGLAKLTESAGSAQPAAGRVPVSMSPTITSPALMTGAGVLLGTAAYMAPEQARGQAVDKRGDIWAFGCVLFEMLTGARAFPGDDVTDTIAAVVRAEPLWSGLPPGTPASVRRLLRRALMKNRRDRLPDIAVARLEIDDALTSPHVAEVAEAAKIMAASKSPLRLITAILAVLCGIAVAVAAIEFVYFRSPAADTNVYRATVLMSGVNSGIGRFGAGLAAQHILAVSPDGRRLAFIAAGPNGNSQLWVRPLDGAIAQPLSGTENADSPFWSPDSRFIGFFVNGTMKRIEAGGGAAVTICSFLANAGSITGAGATWNSNGVIVFSDFVALYSVSAAGGTPSLLLAAPSAKQGSVLPRSQVATYSWPFFLPDGRHFLYRGADLKTYVGTLDSNDTRVLGGGGNAQYAQGHLIFWRDGAVMAQPLDLSAQRLTGEPVPLAESVQGAATGGSFSVSATGVLVYEAAGSSYAQLVWLDRTGKELGSVGAPGAYETMQLSPDEQLIGVGRSDRTGGVVNLWIIDPRRTVSSRLTFGSERESNPAWSPDGRRIAFNSTRKGIKSLYDMASTGGDEKLLMQGGSLSVSDRSKDGRFLLFNDDVTRDLWVLPLSGDRKPLRVVHPTSGRVDQPNFSPDGKWIAYDAEESGRAEVYITPFPPTNDKWQISSAGGVQPRWRGDGGELFYLAPDGAMMSVDLKMGARVEAGAPRALFRTTLVPSVSSEQFAATRDGQRFLVMKPIADAQGPAASLVINWPALLKK